MSARIPGKFVIGLTGNIATGKSVVRRMLGDLGAAAIDADQVAHQVIRKAGRAYGGVIAAFGEDILDADGEISRPALGAIVFADKAKLRQLEKITHPAIRAVIYEKARAATNPVVVIEAIKLLEGDLKQAVDSIWVVDASRETQLARLTGLRGMRADQARTRVDLQNSQADKLRQADVIIRNDGALDATRAQVEREWRERVDAKMPDKSL